MNVNQIDLELHCLDLPADSKDDFQVKLPDQLEHDLGEPPEYIDEEILDRIQGSMIGMALGDALGAHVEFRPREYLLEHRVTDLQGGGTWGLDKGQVLVFFLISIDIVDNKDLRCYIILIMAKEKKMLSFSKYRTKNESYSVLMYIFFFRHNPTGKVNMSRSFILLFFYYIEYS